LSQVTSSAILSTHTKTPPTTSAALPLITKTATLSMLLSTSKNSDVLPIITKTHSSVATNPQSALPEWLNPENYWLWVALAGIIFFCALTIVTGSYLYKKNKKYRKEQFTDATTTTDNQSIATTTKLSNNTTQSATALNQQQKHSATTSSTTSLSNKLSTLTAPSMHSEMSRLMNSTNVKSVIETYTLVTKEKELSIPGYLQVDNKTDFEIKNKIAVGGFGSIHMGTLKSTSTKRLDNDRDECVVKVLPCRCQSLSESTPFLHLKFSTKIDRSSQFPHH
jgi:hypothetical protein